jgi:hypothetical protein
VGVPVTVLVDIDVLSDREKFCHLFESMGGRRSEIEDDVRAILASVGARKGQLTAAELSIELDRVAAELKGQTQIESKVRNKISELNRTGSNWQRVKEDGYRAFVDAKSIQAFERIAAASKRLGLLINREGELEGFARDISRTRKSDWLANALQRDLAEDQSLAEARHFAREIRECFSTVTTRAFSD